MLGITPAQKILGAALEKNAWSSVR